MASTSLYGSRNKSQAPLSQHTATRLPYNLDRTFQPLYAPKCSIIISVSIDPTTRPVATYASHATLRYACFNAYATISAGGGVATSHKAMVSSH
jgi:hypothetical protein